MTTLDDPRRIVDPGTVSIWPTANRFGGIMGLISIVLGLLMYIGGFMEPEKAQGGAGMGIGCLSGVITIVMLVFAIKKHRDQDLGGAITLGRAIGLGTAIGLVSGVIGAVWNVVLYNFIAPELNEMTKEAMMAGAQPGSEEFMEKMANVMTNPVFQPIMTIVGSVITCLILSLIIGAIMKKDPAPTV